jgi:hypothetical protein
MSKRQGMIPEIVTIAKGLRRLNEALAAEDTEPDSPTPVASPASPTPSVPVAKAAASGGAVEAGDTASGTGLVRWLGSGAAVEAGDIAASADIVAWLESAPEYRTELMELQRQAIRHFSIGPEPPWPKNEELEPYFLAQTLPNGAQVSAKLARALATMCRPLANQKGGAKRRYRKSP